MLVKYEKLLKTKLVAKCVCCGKKIYSNQPIRRLDGKVICVTHPINIKKEEK